jgi:hypothetical protein
LNALDVCLRVLMMKRKVKFKLESLVDVALVMSPGRFLGTISRVKIDFTRNNSFTCYATTSIADS